MNTKPKKSGKREAGWIVFGTVTGLLVWIIKLHTEGFDMSSFVGLMSMAWPASMAAAVGPHVLHFMKPPVE